eukprot:1159404-Pelagomonas_calceolata.AAC.12
MPSGNKCVGTHKINGMKFASKFGGSLLRSVCCCRAASNCGPSLATKIVDEGKTVYRGLLCVPEATADHPWWGNGQLTWSRFFNWSVGDSRLVDLYNSDSEESLVYKSGPSGRGKSPYINKGKGDTLAQKSRESPPPQSYKKNTLMGIWRVTGSIWIQNLPARSNLIFIMVGFRVLAKTLNPSGNKLVGICNRMGTNFVSKFNGTLVVQSQLFKLVRDLNAAAVPFSTIAQPGRGHGVGGSFEADRGFLVIEGASAVLWDGALHRRGHTGRVSKGIANVLTYVCMPGIVKSVFCMHVGFKGILKIGKCVTAAANAASSTQHIV